MSEGNFRAGIKVLVASGGVDRIVDAIESLAKQKGLTIFARINFARDAAAAGLNMPPTQLLILGNPAAGTALMLAAPSSALDLPLKVLVSQDQSGGCSVSYNTPDYLQQRHGFPATLNANIAGLEKVIQAAVTAAGPS